MPRLDLFPRNLRRSRPISTSRPRSAALTLPDAQGPVLSRVLLLTLGVAWLLSLWSLAVPAGAQDEGAVQVPPPVFGEVIDVRVVNLEVVVTEKGVRVSGLGPDDFQLEVDGREVPIEYFTEVVGGTAVTPTSAAGTVPALAPGEPVGTSYLVFIDEFFSIPTDRDRVIRKIQEQIDYMNPEDRMAVVAYSGRKVEMLTTWNQSREELRTVFRKALERPAYGLQRRAERRVFEIGVADTSGQDPIGETVELLPVSGLTIEEQQLVDLISNQTEHVVLAATSALRSFANPPGRKVMLLFSGGWPNNPTQWVVTDPDRAITVNDYFDGDKLFEPLVETANRLSYTLYPVDVAGVSSSGVDTADIDVGSANLRRTRGIDREQEEELALLGLADDTGGKALLDSASVDALQRVVEDTRSYYWIGFTPSWQGDDTDHKVEIKPRRKGLKIRTRGSFSDLSRESEVTMMIESSLLFGNPPSAVPLAVQVGESKRAGFGKVMVPLKIAIPVGELTFLPQGEKWLADTELRVAVLDEDGNTADIPVYPLGIRTDAQPDPDDFTVFETQVKIRKKPHDMVVSLYDKASGKILSTKIHVDPR